ncbi:MAG TPA: RNA-binding cell elongation regulator Jag/EloR [Anaerolineales bacterium]|nr:RNA-binding cell elongation regulator Jag/EloR [Anaerolineales bacterium]
MEHRTTLEIIAPSVDEAIDKGLGELGVEESQVEVEVLDQGGGGLFGIGGRQARVKLTLKSAAQAAGLPRDQRQPIKLSAAEAENLVSITKATVAELLEHMGVRAGVEVQMGEPDDQEAPVPVLVDIKGGDLSILIGRHAETLNALQLITRLIVGKEVGYAAHIVIDVEGYRKRREEGLRELARKMAKQAVSTGRRQSLEPMSPAERRIIHMELRHSSEVTTESTGEEPRRKVTIVPKQI